jgi:hypothetical protein
MNGTSDVDATVEAPRAAAANYSGAIYGSLLAASVVVGASAGGDYNLGPLRLAALLVATGLVFWLAHAYARLVGDRIHHAELNRRELIAVARHEWPLLQASLVPAAAAVVVALVGASNVAAAWAALTAAIVAQVGWATAASVRAGANGPLVVLTALVNLALGLIIVILKAALQH